MQSGVDTGLAETGRIDVLVNNAWYRSYGALEDVSIDEARRQFEVNIFGAIRLAQLVLPHMRERRSRMIVNVSSGRGRNADVTAFACGAYGPSPEVSSTWRT